MIGYITLGTNNRQKAEAFYDALLAELDCIRTMKEDTFTAWGPKDDPKSAGLALTIPFDGAAATPGNGTMVALQAKDRQTVDRTYAKAIAAGAKDEGAPGERGFGDFYAGYFRDPDGNKLNVFHMTLPG